MKIQLKLLKGKYIVPIIALAIGIILLAIPSEKTDNNQSNENTNITYYTSELEGKLTSLLLEVEGIDKVNVMITLENSGEQVLAENKSNYSSEYVIINSGNADEGIKLTEIYPVVRGVAIVCTNGNDSMVREKITSLVSSALGIPSNRITVVG